MKEAVEKNKFDIEITEEAAKAICDLSEGIRTFCRNSFFSPLKLTKIIALTEMMLKKVSLWKMAFLISLGRNILIIST